MRTQTPTKTAKARIRKQLKNVTVNRWLALGNVRADVSRPPGPSSEQRDGIIMYQQTANIGIVDKLVIGLMTIMLLVAGFFASLPALALADRWFTVVGKAWWLKRRHDKTVIGGRIPGNSEIATSP